MQLDMFSTGMDDDDDEEDEERKDEAFLFLFFLSLAFKRYWDYVSKQ